MPKKEKDKMSKKIKIVVGCSFGDEGKGLMTDYFSTNPNTVVICHNGGAQKGHTVVTPDGKRHVFNHFGSGTLANADTYLSEDYILNPMLFRREYDELSSIGYMTSCVPKVFVNEKCLVTTPYDMMINQIAEEQRKDSKHGSCGTGIFETIIRNKLESFQLSAKKAFSDNLWMDSYISSLTNRIKNIYVGRRLLELDIRTVSDEWNARLTSENIIANYMDDLQFMKEHIIVISDESVLLNGHDNIVFEGAQGLLLDQNNKDYFPNLTPSNTGLTNPIKILKDNGLTHEDIEVCYVTRSYVTRHGAGRFDTECESNLIGENLIDSTNVPNPFQDTLRYGKLDLNLLVSTIKNDLTNIDFNARISLAITHLDQTKYILKCSDYDRISNDAKLGMFQTIYTSDGASRNRIMKNLKR